MDKDSRFTKVKEELLRRVKTWDDWYEVIDDLLARAVDTHSLPFVLDSMFVMAAFLRAMRDLPEEGDITVLVEQTARILVYESKEKLGVDLAVLTTDEAIGAIASTMKAAAAREALKAMGGEEKKVTLH